MRFPLPTNKVPFSIVIGVKTNSPETIVLQAFDGTKQNTYYVNRKGNVDGYREFTLSFPKSPSHTVIDVFNKRYGQNTNTEDKSFAITKFKVQPVKEKPIWLTQADRSFIKFAQEFAGNAALLSAGERRPHIYRSDDGKFTIDYYQKIRDKKTGEIVNTPARIGHNSGIIEASKVDFVNYSVPMIVAILLHEYSHKYKNPTSGNPINYETGADIHALYMYLSLGYSPIEALQVYLYVFKGANNEVNHKRYKIIEDFTTKFINGDIDDNFTSKK